MKKTVYLCGPDLALPDNQTLASKGKAISWRAATFHFCLKHGIQVINPITEVKSALNTNGHSFIAGDRTRKEIEQALSLVDRCDFLLANLYSPDESSWIPLIYAHGKGKQTVVWTPFPVSPWLASYAKASFESLEAGIEYILAQANDDQKSIIDWSIQYETSLKERSEKFPIDGDADFQYFPGDENKNVLIVAPHATSYWHFGDLFEAENYTGALSAALGRLTGSHSIVSSYCSAEDSMYTSMSSNKSSTNPLVNFIKKIIDIHKIELVLLIRGNNWLQERDLKAQFYLPSTEFDSSKLHRFQNALQEQSSARHINCRQEKGGEDYPLKKLAASLQKPIVELSIHKSFLIPQMQRAQYHNLVTMLEATLDEV